MISQSIGSMRSTAVVRLWNSGSTSCSLNTGTTTESIWRAMQSFGNCAWSALIMSILYESLWRLRRAQRGRLREQPRRFVRRVVIVGRLSCNRYRYGRWLDSDRKPVFPQGALRGVKHLDYPQAVVAVTPRIVPHADAVEKVLAFEPQRFAHFYIRDNNVSEAQRYVFREAVVVGILRGAFVINTQLL